MAENVVAIDGSFTSATNPVSIRVTGSTGNQAAVGAPAAGSPGLLTLRGFTAAFTTLNAVTTNATGVAADCGSTCSQATIVAVPTATLVGTVTLEGSLDNTTWVSTGTTITLVAATVASAFSVDKPFRFFRASLSAAAGSGSLTVKFICV
jgi:hypothetical protein